MAKNGNGGGGSPGKGGSLMAGLVLGMIVGVAIAGGVAWYILKKNPETFHAKEAPHEPPKMALPASAPAPAPASAVPEAKPHFEFYKTLPDKPEVTPSRKSAERPAPKPAPAPHVEAKPHQAAPAVPKETYFVQAGSFQNRDDAEKLKAKLALLGMEASIQTVNLPEKGVWHRVRLGPYQGQEEANKTIGVLKQNGVANAAPVRTQ